MFSWIHSDSWAGVSLINYSLSRPAHLVKSLHLAQQVKSSPFPLGLEEPGGGWDSQNQSQLNPAIRADAFPCRATWCE